MRRTVAALSTAALVATLSALPVVGPSAATAHPVPPKVWSLPLSGVDGSALASAVGRASLAAAASSASGKRALGGTEPGAPEVLTAPTRTAQGFELIGVTWRPDASVDPAVLVRVDTDHGWGSWTALDNADKPDPSEGTHLRSGTEPLWVGSSDGYQVRVDVRGGRLPSGLRVDLVDPGSSPADAAPGGPVGGPAASAGATALLPRVYTRPMWGADERIRERTPSYSPTIKAGFVHHTATANGYSRADVPKIIRAIYAYHVESNGWSDIGYNFLVDRFGRLWVGRYGSVQRPVIGAHTGGFNTDTFGVAAIGNYSTAGAPTVMTGRIAALMAWRLDRYHRNPLGRAVLTSTGTGTSRYPAGRRVSFDAISGHRDAGFTECPGNNLYAKLGAIRSMAADKMGAAVLNPRVWANSRRWVHVNAWTLRPGHTWRVAVRDLSSGQQVSRHTHRAKGRVIDAAIKVPRPGRYLVMVRSWGDGRLAREYRQVLTVR